MPSMNCCYNNGTRAGNLAGPKYLPPTARGDENPPYFF